MDSTCPLQWTARVHLRSLSVRATDVAISMARLDTIPDAVSLGRTGTAGKEGIPDGAYKVEQDAGRYG